MRSLAITGATGLSCGTAGIVLSVDIYTGLQRKCSSLARRKAIVHALCAPVVLRTVPWQASTDQNLVNHLCRSSLPNRLLDKCIGTTAINAALPCRATPPYGYLQLQSR
ncbi:hypothetical protein HCU01_20640 [Halomonas cupida]|uniref:Secreted protein n=1 Tax=Halomonas cupida TaxID=44933 RepID=A0ABQ0WER9_9GAMM|nr:hypothetical protein HCU01_20640 [Halomonas cupida]